MLDTDMQRAKKILRAFVLGITIMVVLSTTIMVILKYPTNFWAEVAPGTVFTILALLAQIVVIERLVAAHKVVAFLAIIILRGFSWMLLLGWAVYLQVEIGHTEILIILLGAGVLILSWYRIDKIAHK